MMVLGQRSHQTRACFDIPKMGGGVGHGRSQTGAATVSHSGWLPESGSERTLRVSLQKVGRIRD